jgi:putative chitinase
MQITHEQMKELIPANQYAAQWCDVLNKILPGYNIDTAQRVSGFIAQCAHESMGFVALKENLNYSKESLLSVFSKYFKDAATAEQYARKQEAIANRVYANRMGNGDEASGDGYRYCGRGLIQLTGHDNYQAFADSLEMLITAVPDYLATYEGAVQSACWFWETNKLNQYADSNDIVTMTKRINGGTIGLDDRIKHYEHALKVFGA